MEQALCDVRTPISPASLAKEALLLRRQLVEALYMSGGGHYGGSLSVVDVLLALYRTQLRIDPVRARHPDRDRLILSKGHAALALYAVQRAVGLLNEPLDTYGKFGSPLEGHPDMTVLHSVDFSTGSLGQGLAVGAGMALALRQSARPDSAAVADREAHHKPRVWVVLGDGECQEGQVWEAAMIAARYELDNLVAVIDANGYQEWGWSGHSDPDHVPVPHLDRKWRAFGWRVLLTDGHDFEALLSTYREAKRATGTPTAVIAQTVKGKGVPLAEADPVRFHCTEVTVEEHRRMIESLGATKRVER